MRNLVRDFMKPLLRINIILLRLFRAAFFVNEKMYNYFRRLLAACEFLHDFCRAWRGNIGETRLEKRQISIVLDDATPLFLLWQSLCTLPYLSTGTHDSLTLIVDCARYMYVHIYFIISITIRRRQTLAA